MWWRVFVPRWTLADARDWQNGIRHYGAPKVRASICEQPLNALKRPRANLKSYEEIAQHILSGARVLPVGGGTKAALSALPEGFSALPMQGLSGIVEYDPSEFTITARAGTPLSEIVMALAEHGQYLPWDPPLVEAGATLGGAIAAGLSGSGRYRYGGLRDFLVGIRFVDGAGRLVRGGGKVVKNAAGFDLPKLFVGSMGRLGVLVEATFKVFPQPQAWTTVRLPLADLGAAQGVLAKLAHAPLDLNAVDVEIDAAGAATVWMRLGGLASTLQERAERLREFAGGEILADADETQWWAQSASLAWAEPTDTLFYTALLPSRLCDVDSVLAQTGAQRRYLCGGSMLWIAADAGATAAVESALQRLDLTAVRVRGGGAPLLNAKGVALLRRVKQTLDPNHLFPDYP